MPASKGPAERTKEVRKLLEKGPLSRQEILTALNSSVSQASFSRTVRVLQNEIIVLGKGRTCRYGRIRSLEGLENPIPIFHVQETGKILKVGSLRPIFPDAFVFESKIWTSVSGVFSGLPWFLEHVRPSGFLGRRIPHLYPELSPQKDIRLWSDETCLRFACQYGDSLQGSLICGKPAMERMLSFQAAAKPRGILSSERERAYPELALGQLESGLESSSADGEQPKFLTHIVDENRGVVVKYGPTLDTPVGRRVADLLICESLALKTLEQAGIRAASCTIFEFGNRVFLESTRFDRTHEGGRRPLHSLFALAAQHTGIEKGWYETAVALIGAGIIPKSAEKVIATLECFGHLIANSDMHLHNLAFESSNCQVTAVAPAYDMLPMLFYPQSHHVAEPEWSLGGTILSRMPRESWLQARALAERFWQSVINSNAVSDGFRRVAGRMEEKVARLAELLGRLPGDEE